MEDNPYFKIVAPQPWKPSPLEPNELHRGDWWSITLENGAYFLNYLTGHLVSYEKRIPISKSEAEGLIAGELDADKILRAHGAD